MGIGTISGTINVAGVGFPFHLTEEDEGVVLHQVTAPMAYAAVVTSGVGTKAGVITTTDTSPTITTDDYVDIYWEVGGVKGVLYNADVSNVTAGAVTVIDTNGMGDNLPANTSACIIAVHQVIAGEFEGGDASILAVRCNAGRSYVVFAEGSEAAGSAHFAHDVPDGEGWVWSEGFNGITNPIAGHTIDNIWVSTADVTADQLITVGILYDSVS